MIAAYSHLLYHPAYSKFLTHSFCLANQPLRAFLWLLLGSCTTGVCDRLSRFFSTLLCLS